MENTSLNRIISKKVLYFLFTLHCEVLVIDNMLKSEINAIKYYNNAIIRQLYLPRSYIIRKLDRCFVAGTASSVPIRASDTATIILKLPTDKLRLSDLLLKKLLTSHENFSRIHPVIVKNIYARILGKAAKILCCFQNSVVITFTSGTSRIFRSF